MRDDSGWKTAEPSPTHAAAITSSQYCPTHASISSPTSVKPIPTLSERGCGFRSVYHPTSGCSSDAVSWKAKASSPTCVKLAGSSP